MGLIRGAYRAGKAAAKGQGAEKILSEGAKGLMPKAMEKMGGGSLVDNNISRVTKGVRDVLDTGRSTNFHDSSSDIWGDRPTGVGAPTITNSSATPTRPKPSGPGAPPSNDVWGDSTGNWKPNSDSGKLDW